MPCNYTGPIGARPQASPRPVGALWEAVHGHGTQIGALSSHDAPPSTVHRPYYHHHLKISVVKKKQGKALR